MKRHALVIGLVAALTGCGTDDPASSEPVVVAWVRDANNYRTESELTIPVLETAVTDLDVCWSGVTEDLQCHRVSPEQDIQTVSLLRFRGSTQAAVTDRLEQGELALSDIHAYFEFRTGQQSTCTKLSSFGFFTTPIDVKHDFVESDDYIYLLVFAAGTTPGVGARSTAFLKPTSASTESVVRAPNGCGILDFTAHLSEAEPIELPRQGPWKLDWSGVTVDGQGNAAALDGVDRALVGFYPEMTVEDIEQNIFDVELLADPLWEVSVDGQTSTELGAARQRGDDSPFPGFEREQDGVWLFGLVCSECQNPQPVVLSVLNPTNSAP